MVERAHYSGRSFQIIFNSFMKQCIRDLQSATHTLVGEGYQPKGLEVRRSRMCYLAVKGGTNRSKPEYEHRDGPISPTGAI